MKIPALLLSDPHFTANPRDEYRWTIWKWLRDLCVEERIKTLVICGDLTDAKDYHSSTLVNRLVGEIAELAKLLEDLIILQGNHDYLKNGHAYFAFLNLIPNVRFIVKPTEVMLDDGPSALFLPHVKNPAQAWTGWDFSHYELLFIHQTIKGSVASNGQEMDGEPLPELNAGKVWSGDIHVPQKIGPIEYIGSPYHVHFGDSFEPRCVLLERRRGLVEAHDFHFQTIRKHSLKVSSMDELESYLGQLMEGDQVKLTIQLTQADKHEWPALKRQALAFLRENGLIVEGAEMVLERTRRRFSNPGKGNVATGRLSDALVVERFIKAEGLTPDALDAGLDLLGQS